VTRPLAVVTGASSGIGEAFAAVLAEAGHDVLLVARRAERLERLATELGRRHGVTAHPFPLDLADSAAAAKVAARVDELDRPVAVLVNNAGRFLHGGFLDQPWDVQAGVLQLMVHTPTELIRRLLPAMLAAGRGRVVTIASMGGFFHSTPQETLYAPVKHYGIALSRSLAGQYRGTGVTFTAVCPGFVRTEMMQGHPGTAAAGKRLPGFAVMTAEQAARAGWAAAERGDRVVIPGAVNKALVVALKLLPTEAGDALVTKAFDILTKVN
jgi:short-subunit dehydrogenase